MGAEPVKAKSPHPALRNRLELTANPVPPRFLHTEHGRVRRETKARACPGFLYDLSFHLELVRVSRVLHLASAAGAEVGTGGGHAVLRWLDDSGRSSHRHPTLPAPGL